MSKPGLLRPVHRREEVMGTVVTFDIYPNSGSSEQELGMRIARARAILQRADAVFSTWKEMSPISRLRRGEIEIGATPPEVGMVLASCEIARELSDGWFDPWAMPGGVDPSGYVKGWAAQRALSALVSGDYSGALVNAAGDVASFGGLVDGRAFRIGIVDPFAPRKLAAVVELVGAIATSGTYERGEHLIDPRSGRPASTAASATVCGPDLGLADALATALAVSGEAGLKFIDKLEGYEALVIALDGRWHQTNAFPVCSA
jgi:thiamine biosynthesis lipoprotein